MAVDLTRPSVWIKGVAAFWRHDKTREAIGVLAMATAVLCLAALATFNPRDPSFFTYASVSDRQVRNRMPAPPACHERCEVLAKANLWPGIPDREREGIKVREAVSGLILSHTAFCPVHEICHAGNCPFTFQVFCQLAERLFAFETDNSVESRQGFQDFFILECREVSPGSHVAGVPGLPDSSDQRKECRCPALEGHRDGDQFRMEFLNLSKDPAGILRR